MEVCGPLQARLCYTQGKDFRWPLNVRLIGPLYRPGRFVEDIFSCWRELNHDSSDVRLVA